jgi:hypothetical protein
MLIYLFFEVKCFDLCNTSIIKPIFFGLLGLIPTLLLLLCFPQKVFIAWAKYIVWWAMLFTVWAVPNFSDDLFFSRIWITNACMVLLFVLTFIYAIVYIILTRRSDKKETVNST